MKRILFLRMGFLKQVQHNHSFVYETYFIFTNWLFEISVQPNPSLVYETYFVLQEWAFRNIGKT